MLSLHKKCNSRNAKFIPDPHGDNAGVAHKPHLTHTAKTSIKSNHQSPIILAGELHSAPYIYVRIWVTQRIPIHFPEPADQPRNRARDTLRTIHVEGTDPLNPVIWRTEQKAADTYCCKILFSWRKFLKGKPYPAKHSGLTEKVTIFLLKPNVYSVPEKSY